MMAVKVSDLLALPLLREGKIVAGIGGLSQQVRSVSFTDHPIVFSEEEYALTAKGDLYICGFFLFREDIDKLYNRIRFYIKTQSSCCIITVEAFDELPPAVIDLANQNNYPIILIPDEIPYAEVIHTITEAIFLSETMVAFEKKVDALLYDNLSPEESADAAKHFYSFHQAEFAVFFCSIPEAEKRHGDLQRELESRLSQREMMLYRYKGELFGVAGLTKKQDLPTFASLLVRSLNLFGSPYFLGISTAHRSPSEFGMALREAFQCCRICAYQQQPVIVFGQEPFFQLLYELRHQPPISAFCRNTLRPLLEYKERHDINLIETLRVFFRCNGNYKQTAAELFRHENTVRFQIAKAKSLLGLEEDTYRFIKEVSLAIDLLPFLRESD